MEKLTRADQAGDCWCFNCQRMGCFRELCVLNNSRAQQLRHFLFSPFTFVFFSVAILTQ
jgi:hypothetical protein